MKRGYIGIALGALVAVGAALSLQEFGHPQKLVSVQVQPSGFTFWWLLQVKQRNPRLRYLYSSARGGVISLTKSRGAWTALRASLLLLAAPPGTVTTQGGCGVSDVAATAPEGTGGSSNIVVGYGTVTVDNPDISYCPGGSSQQATLAVVLAGSGDGTVTSVPAGITCPGSCGAQILIGNLVVLEATPNTGHTFVSWNGCTPGNPSNTCSLTMPASGVLISATFD